MRKVIPFLAVLTGVVFLIYSVLEYRKTGVAERGLVTCVGEQCYWTAHIHALVRINVCGQEISLPKLVGPLSGVHTHTEENILHWHDRLLIDPVSRKPIDPWVLTIGSGLDILSITMATDGIMEEKNGDLCPDGKEGTLKFFVNGVPYFPDPHYVWEDRDIIDIVFDGRTPAEAAEYIKTLPTEFPSLTNG